METVFLDVDDRIMMCTTNKLESICQLSQLRGSLFACKLVLLHTIMCTIIIQKQKKYNRGKWKSEPRFPSGQPPSHGDAWNRHARRCPYGKWLGSPGSELGEGSAMGERVWENVRVVKFAVCWRRVCCCVWAIVFRWFCDLLLHNLVWCVCGGETSLVVVCLGVRVRWMLGRFGEKEHSTILLVRVGTYLCN